MRPGTLSSLFVTSVLECALTTSCMSGPTLPVAKEKPQPSKITKTTYQLRLKSVLSLFLCDNKNTLQAFLSSSWGIQKADGPGTPFWLGKLRSQKRMGSYPRPNWTSWRRRQYHPTILLHGIQEKLILKLSRISKYPVHKAIYCAQ